MCIKYFYSFNSDENIYTGKFPAIKNPRRETEYLLPSRATFKAPPKTNNNEVAVWQDNDWVIMPDFRGEMQVNINTKEISKINYIGPVKDVFQKITKEIAEDIKLNPDKYKKVNNEIIDISETEEYKNYLRQKKIDIRRNELMEELIQLDNKRVRAMCEPSIKNDANGQTWLEYYNAQAKTLRDELNNL